MRPRLVLSEVIAPTLSQREIVNEHRFPAHRPWSDSVASAVQAGEIPELSPAQQEALEGAALDDADRLRARTLLRAWTTRAQDAEQVMAVLGLNVEIKVRPDGLGDPPTEDSVPTPEPEKAEPGSPPVDADATRVQDWGGGAVTLGPTLARELRGVVWDELQDGIRWPELGLNRAVVLEALGIKGARQQVVNQAVRIENAAGGGAMAAAAADVRPLATFAPTAGNARTLLAFRRMNRGTADLDDLAHVRRAVQDAEATVIERLAGTAATRARVTDHAKLLTLAFSPLAGATGIEERPDWRIALSNLEDLPTSAEYRTAAWTQMQNMALQQHGLARRAIEATASRSQGGAGAATALDATLIDEVALSRDPDGLKRPPGDAALAAHHARLLEAGSDAVAQESQAIQKTLLVIAGHVGEDGRLPLKTISDAVKKAMQAAESADLLMPHAKAAEIRSMRMPNATAAAAVIESAWVAVRSAERGVGIDALFRLGAVDVQRLALVRRYLDLAAEVVAASTAQAASAIEQRGEDGSSQLGELVRTTASDLATACEVPR